MKDDLHGGFIRLYRKIRDTWIYNKDDYLKAWTDILMEVNYNKEPQERIFKSSVILINRGEMAYSLRFFSDRWNWSTSKVERFLNHLQKDGKIKRRHLKKHSISILSVCSYNTYNPLKNDNETVKETVIKQSSNSDEAVTKQSSNKSNKDKESNKEISKDIYMPIFVHWNISNIIIHRKMTDKIKRPIRVQLKIYTELEIITAITNYSTVLNSDKHFFNYKWTLEDFLNRGLGRFVDESDPLNNFLNNGNIGNKQPEHGDTKPTKDGNDRFKSLHYWNPLNLESGGKWVTYRTWQYNCENKTDGIGYWQQSGTKQTEPSNYEK